MDDLGRMDGQKSSAMAALVNALERRAPSKIIFTILNSGKHNPNNYLKKLPFLLSLLTWLKFFQNVQE
jgi:hypothetical protein